MGTEVHCSSKRNKEGKPIKNYMQKEISIANVGKIQSGFTERG